MTTSVTVSVNGRYVATVKQDDLPPVAIDGSYGGDAARRTFSLPHPASSTFVITEEAVPEAPAAEAPPVEQPDPPPAKDDGQTA